jgi:hypothetical protein
LGNFDLIEEEFAVESGPAWRRKQERGALIDEDQKT